MEASEYFKKYGLLESKRHLEWMLKVGARKDIHGYFMEDLKRLIESHELVGSYGGLDLARKEAHKDCFEFNATLLKAIADVEACNKKPQ